MQEQKHTLIIEQRKNIKASGVESVVAFSEVKIILRLHGGEKLFVIGSNLKITGFAQSQGEFTAEGEINGVSYSGKPVLSRLFK